MIAKSIAFGSIVDVSLYPRFEYLEIGFLVLLPDSISSTASNEGFFAIIGSEKFFAKSEYFLFW
jgi:hypothetical protein